MNLGAWFAGHKPEAAAGAGGLVVIAGLYARSKKAAAAAQAATNARSTTAAAGPATVPLSGTYDSSVNDAYNSLEQQLAAQYGNLQTQLGAMNPPAAAPPVAPPPAPTPPPATPPAAAPPPPPPAPAPRTYVVVQGDTMWGIARKFGVSLSALEQANPQLKRGSHNWNLIYPGDVVNIPG